MEDQMELDLTRLEEIFDEALRRSPGAERSAFIDSACGENAELRRRSARLLASHETAGAFMSVPSRAPHDETPPAQIGPYKLLEQIGEGGFGAVFMAEQNVPIHRRVALKVIKLGMDTRQVVARFAAERQALAMMDHVNIARVLDAGATDSGRPYFVMELVRGVPITEFR
jgi:serine/threonine protein kinase